MGSHMHIKVTPRRLPKSIDQVKALQQFSKQKYQHLLFSVLADGASIVTDAVPALGQLASLITAVIYGTVIFTIYRKQRTLAVVAAMGGFLMELTQSIDLVPVAMIVWVYAYMITGSKTLECFFEEKRRNFDYLNNHHL